MNGIMMKISLNDRSKYLPAIEHLNFVRRDTFS